MIPHRIRGPFTALVAASGIAACSPAASAQGAAQPHPANATNSPATAIARAQADSARLPWTEADAGFMTGMIGHHAQAIEMSLLAPSRTTTRSIRTLAARIINAQQDEIGIMQRWLADRRQPVPDPQAGAMGPGGHEGHSGHLMPGMLTPAQLLELEQAEGEEFDRLFLVYMIQHHRGAVAMVEALFASQGAGQDETVFKFASDVNVDQATEIARMQQMLANHILGRGTQ